MEARLTAAQAIGKVFGLLLKKTFRNLFRQLFSSEAKKTSEGF